MAKRLDIIEAFLEDCQALALLRRERNLTRVAELLDISRQRLSTRFERLQSQFNQPLFSDEFELTELGQPLAEIGLMAELLKDRARPNQVKVGCTIGVHHFILEEIILKFETDTSPHISVIRVGGSKQELPDMVREGAIDMAIFDPDGSIPNGLVGKKIWEIEYYALVPKRFNLLAGKPDGSITFNDFKDLPLIVSSRKDSRVLQAFKKANLALRSADIIVKTQNYFARIEFANQGKGVTFVPSYSVFKPSGFTKVNHEKVAVKNLAHLVENRTYYLFHHEDRSLSAADEKFIEFLYSWEPKIMGVKRIDHRT